MLAQLAQPFVEKHEHSAEGVPGVPGVLMSFELPTPASDTRNFHRATVLKDPYDSLGVKYRHAGHMGPVRPKKSACLARFFRLHPPGVACFQGLDMKAEEEARVEGLGFRA